MKSIIRFVTGSSNFSKILVVLPFLCLFIACNNDDDDSFVRATVNGEVLIEDVSDFNGDIDASFTGNGGSGTFSFIWNNNLRTADYNADITASSEGSFQMIVEDSEGEVVLDRSIQGATEPDSIDGVTSGGTSGIWTVTIILTNFNGDGSFSLSEGD